MRGLALFVGLLPLSGQAAALPCSSRSMPMPEAEASEKVVHANAALQASCQDLIRGKITIGAPLGPPSFTRHPKWGAIMRMDVGPRKPNSYGRILCVQSQGMMRISLYRMNDRTCDAVDLAVAAAKRKK